MGSPGFNGAAEATALLSGGNRVIAGTSRNISGNYDAIVTCISPSNTALWARENATPGHDRFIAICATSDGGCVAVGYSNQSLFSPYANNQGCIYKFDATGTVLWYKNLKATATGECLYSVIEIPGSGNIVCAGVSDFGGSASGLIVNLNSLGSTNWIKSYDMGSSTEIHDVKYLSGKIIGAGMYNSGSKNVSNIFALNELNGNQIWNRSYNYGSTINPANDNEFSDRLNIVDSNIFVDVYLSGAWAATGCFPSVLSVDTQGYNPVVVEYPISGYIYSNVVSSHITPNKEIFLVQQPSNSHWDKLHSNSAISNNTELFCTKIKDIRNPATTKVFSRKIGTTGIQSLVNAEIIGSRFIGVGTARGDAARMLGSQDLYKLDIDTGFTITPDNCIEDAGGQLFGSPVVTLYLSTPFSSITTPTFVTPVEPTVTTVTYTTNLTCSITLVIADFTFQRTACLTDSFTDLTISTLKGIQYWYWNFGDGGTSTLQHPKHTYASMGSYSVKLVVTDSLGNKDSITKIVTLSAYRFLTAGNDTNICNSSIPASVQLKANGGKTFSWSPGGGLSNPAIANPVATVTGSVKYIVTATDSLGCIDKDSTIITVRSPAINIVPDSAKVCEGADVLLKAGGASKYKWAPTTGLTTDTGSTQLVHVIKTITYLVTGTDSYGCQDMDSVKITILPRAYVTALQDTAQFCPGKTIKLEASGAIRYKWYSDNKDYGDSSSTVSIESTFSQHIKVKGWNAEGCVAIDSVYLSRLPAPNVKIITKDPMVGCDKATVLEANGAQSYTWWPAEYCSNSSGQSTKVSPPNSTWMQVQGIDSLGCTGTDSVWVSFDGKSLVLIPSAFTPNNDNINDKIKPIIICNFSVAEFTIYNRWGQLVFSGQSNNSAWDGTINGKPCDLGTYYYFLKGRDQNNAEIMLKGDITLLR